MLKFPAFFFFPFPSPQAWVKQSSLKKTFKNLTNLWMRFASIKLWLVQLVIAVEGHAKKRFFAWNLSKNLDFLDVYASCLAFLSTSTPTSPFSSPSHLFLLPSLSVEQGEAWKDLLENAQRHSGRNEKKFPRVMPNLLKNNDSLVEVVAKYLFSGCLRPP